MTLDELLAIEEIKQLRSKYSYCYDSADIDGLMSLFTDDAVCEWDASHGGTWDGAEAIRRNYLACFQAYGEGQPWKVMHAVTNPWIAFVDETTAEGRWFMLDFNFLDLTPDPLGCIGIYNDLYKKVDGKWLIHRCKIDFLYPNRELVGGTPGTMWTKKTAAPSEGL